MKFNKTVLLTIGVTLIVGVAIGAIFFGGSPAPSAVVDEHQHEVNAEGLWTCSMHPQVRQAEAGSCPFCGMDLIPVASDDSGDPAVLKMSNAAVQLANIQTTIIGTSKGVDVLRLNGKIKVDERQVNLQTTHFEGRVEKLYKGFEGDIIRKGEKVASIYSPELVSAQEELIEAKKLEKTNPLLIEAARRKLHHWKLSMEQIERIETSKEALRNFDLLSDYEGVVSKKMINTGNHLHEGGGLIEVTDLSTVWAVFEVYERDLSKVSLGDEVVFETSAGGQAYTGKVSFISPEVNPKTRVVEVRADVDNKRMTLKPEMFIEASVTGNGVNGLTVPKSAVLWTGKRSVVYIKVPGDLSFQLREIELGESTDKAYLIKSGLEAGDEVVTNGAFTLDAEAQLKGKISMMNPIVTSSNPENIFEEVELPAVRNYQNEVGPEFREKLTALSMVYINLKDLMVEGNGMDIRKAGVLVKSALGNVNMRLEEGESYEHWLAMRNPMDESLKIITESGDRDKQRLQFINLSKALINAVQSFGTSYESPLYVQFCPMANNNKGATWISKEEEVINPYFGDVMLNCGNVEDIITK